MDHHQLQELVQTPLYQQYREALAAEQAAEETRQHSTLALLAELTQPTPRTSSVRPTRCAWCSVGPEVMEHETCFNAKDICIDCCMDAGDPCGHGESA